MRFEELSHRVDGLPVTVPFHPRLTVVGPLSRRARSRWVERALGVLVGTRPGDNVTLVLAEGSGHRVRLERDHRGVAQVTAVDTGEELTPLAAHLPLDGRFDWFASLGLDADAARALMVLDASPFKRDEDPEPWEIEEDLAATRQALARLEADVEAVQAVGRLEEELASLDSGMAAGRAAAEAALAAAVAGDEWRRAAAPLQDALGLTTGEEPADIVPAHYLQPAFWEGAERVGAARTRLTELSLNLDGDGQHRELLSELEAAHAAVERAERQLDAARMPALAVPARRRLTHAQHQERAVLGRLGHASWLGFQLQRVEALLEWDTVEALRQAELEYQGAAAAWKELAGDADPEAALGARAGIERRAAAMTMVEDRLETLLAQAGLPAGDGADDLPTRVAKVTIRAAEAAVLLETPPSTRTLEKIQVELSWARSALPVHPVGGDGDGHRAEERRETLQLLVATREAASRAGYRVRSVEEAEGVLLARISQARRAGPRGESVPVLIDDAVAGFARHDKWRLLHLLTSLDEAIQIVYLTDDPDTVEWAAAQAGKGHVMLQGGTWVG